MTLMTAGTGEKPDWLKQIEKVPICQTCHKPMKQMTNRGIDYMWYCSSCAIYIVYKPKLTIVNPKEEG